MGWLAKGMSKRQGSGERNHFRDDMVAGKFSQVRHGNGAKPQRLETR
jgi:hypothetical protein